MRDAETVQVGSGRRRKRSNESEDLSSASRVMKEVRRREEDGSTAGHVAHGRLPKRRGRSGAASWSADGEGEGRKGKGAREPFRQRRTRKAGAHSV